MARSAERSIALVLDPDDQLAELEELRRLHSRPYGQILCEPAPTGGSAALARHLLSALGKRTDEELQGGRWPVIEGHLAAEHVRDLVIARAHTLTYPALRRLADHAHGAHTTLWLLNAGERPSTPIAQLLEARPHQHATVEARGCPGRRGSSRWRSGCDQLMVASVAVS